MRKLLIGLLVAAPLAILGGSTAFACDWFGYGYSDTTNAPYRYAAGRPYAYDYTDVSLYPRWNTYGYRGAPYYRGYGYGAGYGYTDSGRWRSWRYW